MAGRNRVKQKSHLPASHCSVQTKPGFGIGDRIQGPIAVLELKFFSPKPKLFFIISHVFLRDIVF